MRASAASRSEAEIVSAFRSFRARSTLTFASCASAWADCSWACSVEVSRRTSVAPLRTDAPDSKLVGSQLSIVLNASGFGLQKRTEGFTDGQTLELGSHRLRFLETPQVHHWDSMMVVEESTNSLFPSDLYLQPGDQPPTSNENMTAEMLDVYREVGIFAAEKPVRDVADRIAQLAPDWIHSMHGATINGEALHYYTTALREHEFCYRGLLLGREVGAPAPAEG